MDSRGVSWPDRLKELWGRLSSGQRIGIIGAGVVALALAIYAGVLAQSPDYATLFSGMSEQDAAAVVDKLKELQIPYRLASGGTTIQVPQQKVYDTRLEMAKAALPKGSTVGYELFDGSQLNNLGMTDFMQRLQYQRALEGELARTIGSLDPVASARVHIVIPEPNLYTSDEKAPSASIVVQLKDRSELSHGQVQAITHLVASSVEGLKAGNITLVDVAGNVMTAAGENDGIPASVQAGTNQLDMQRTYEIDLERRLQAVLDQAVGPNQGIVRVSATLNWDQKQTNSETYAPVADNAGVVRSEQIQEETDASKAAGANGVPGIDSNTVPGYPVGTPQAATASGYVKRNTTRNYELSKVVQTVTQAPGSIKRLSVAVLLSEKVPADQAPRLQSMLTTAAGLDTSRGDTVAVERLPFSSSIDSTGTSLPLAGDRTTQIWSLARLAGLLLAILLLLRFARLTLNDLSSRLATGGHRVRVVDEEVGVMQPGRQLPAPTIAGEATPAGAAARRALQEEVPLALPPTDEEIEELPAPMQENVWREHLVALASKRPDLVAELLQTWLTEGS